ncbi:MAG: ATP-binding cassette domain-containing protein [Marinilabiliales bacterium]|nr:ATP-binding cassette domain-containing protein [Marinilabiliales bacterium]
MTEEIISLKNADIYQQNNLILKEVNLTLNKGEFLYIIGKVGSGKTSLLKTFYHELPLVSGEGLIMGYDLKKIRMKEIPLLRRRLGIIFQDFQLLGDRTVQKNFEFVLKATGWRQERAIKERIEEVLNLVEMPDVAQKMPHHLSGGEQQRVGIARAMLNNPQIILADEPTGNLDPETSEKLMVLLHDINKDGVTIIMATHDYEMIRMFPARRVICEKGELREMSPLPEQMDFDSLLEN